MKKILPILIISIVLASNSYTYRDYEIKETKENDILVYEIPKLRYRASSYNEAKIFINAYFFQKATGINDEELISMYIDADLNGNASLELSELEKFQQSIHKKYKYIENEPVLRPDEFIKAGGGDCDDWAEMTAGLLRFWGLDPYIARFGRTKVVGHAICLVKVPEGSFPDKYMYYEISGFGNAPAGIYIPIDYEKVGGLSGVDRRWKISHIDIPENIYGAIR